MAASSAKNRFTIWQVRGMAVLFILLVFSACGLKGDLVLPADPAADMAADPGEKPNKKRPAKPAKPLQDKPVPDHSAPDSQ